MILYDINNKLIGNTNISRNKSFFIRGLKNFQIEIISGKATLYSSLIVSDKNNTVSNKKILKGYLSYTIFFESEIVKLKLDDDYIISLKYCDDKIYDTMYDDLLVNNNLPSQKELFDSILDPENKIETVKRLLLDFREIAINKGKTESIKKFFNLIGFESDNIKLLDVFITPESNITTTPNKYKDIRNGDYQLIYENYENCGLDSNNMPIDKIVFENLDLFSKTLMNAISLANTYFTIEEQEIKFFGMNYSSNIAKFPSITSSTSVITSFDVHSFESKINIDLYKKIDSKNNKLFLENNRLIDKNIELHNSEVKIYYYGNDETNKELFKVYYEICDDEIIEDENIENIKSFFGSIIHLTVNSPDTYVEIEITGLSNIFNTLNYEKRYVEDSFKVSIGNTKTGKYNIRISIYDKWNNREVYNYPYEVLDNPTNIDFQHFSTLNIKANNITTDIDSSTYTYNNFDDNYIVPLDMIPDDLSLYNEFNISQANNFRHLRTNKQYILPTLNMYYSINDVTDTIPVKYVDSWLNILSLKYMENYTLKIRIDNSIIDFESIKNCTSSLDNICVMLYDVIENPDVINQKTPYYIISTTDSGIEITKELYDFVLVNNENSDDVISIYDSVELVSKTIPLNYDIPIKIVESELVPEFKSYVSKDTKIIESLFTKLDENVTNKKLIKYGDVIVCKLDENLVTNVYDITWKVVNAFNNEVLFTSNDLTLKYRIDDKTCFTIECTFFINEIKYFIKKESLFGGFEFQIF